MILLTNIKPSKYRLNYKSLLRKSLSITFSRNHDTTETFPLTMKMTLLNALTASGHTLETNLFFSKEMDKSLT
jgi:hypothetical protein